MKFIVFTLAVLCTGFTLELPIQVTGRAERICQGPHKRNNDYKVLEQPFGLNKFDQHLVYNCEKHSKAYCLYCFLGFFSHDDGINDMQCVLSMK